MCMITQFPRVPPGVCGCYCATHLVPGYLRPQAIPILRGWVHCLAPEAPPKKVNAESSIFCEGRFVPSLPTSSSIKWPCVKYSLVGSLINTKHVHLHTRALMCVTECVRVCACVCVCVCEHMWNVKYFLTCIRVYVCMYVCVCVCEHTLCRRGYAASLGARRDNCCERLRSRTQRHRGELLETSPLCCVYFSPHFARILTAYPVKRRANVHTRSKKTQEYVHTTSTVT